MIFLRQLTHPICTLFSYTKVGAFDENDAVMSEGKCVWHPHSTGNEFHTVRLEVINSPFSPDFLQLGQTIGILNTYTCRKHQLHRRFWCLNIVFFDWNLDRVLFYCGIVKWTTIGYISHGAHSTPFFEKFARDFLKACFQFMHNGIPSSERQWTKNALLKLIEKWSEFQSTTTWMYM